MMKRVIRLGMWLLAIVILGSLLVDRYRSAGEPAPVQSLMPDLADYDQVEGRPIVNYVGALAQGAALLAGQPQLAAAVGSVDRTVSCFNDLGAVQARVYSHRDQPLAAGAIAVADLDELSDPTTLAQCLAPDLLSLESTEPLLLQPCSGDYGVIHDGRAMMVVYVGSTEAVCADFCANLAGCEESSATNSIAP